MPANGKEIVQRFDKLDREAALHKDQWERMAPYLAPSRVGILGGFSDGAKLQRQVYDSTMLMAAELMSMFIAGHVINPSQQWLDYTVDDLVASKDDEAKEWFEEVRDITLKNLSNSLFYAEGTESIIDTTGFGTGFLLAEEAPQPANQTIRGFRGFMFTAVKTGRFLIQEGVDGRIDTAFRVFDLTARVIKDRWPDVRLPERIANTLREGEQDKQFCVIHSIQPRPKAEQGAGNKGMPWASVWVEKESKEIIFESGYREFPAAVPRYSKTPGEVFGRGRGHIAFADTWTLNTAKRMALEDWALKIRPPILHGHDSVIGVLKLVPGGPTAVNTHGRPIAEQVQAFQTGSHPEVSQINEENLRKSIREIFYAEQILALMEIHKSEMTIFEFSRKLELLFRLMGPVYGRIEWELLHRSTKIIFNIQAEAGAFPPPPPVLEGKAVNVIFKNPIARSQRAGDAESLTMALNDLAPIAQLDPSILDWLDNDKAAIGILDTRGVPAKWTRSQKEVATRRAARDAQNQADLQLERATQVAEAAGKVAPALAAVQPKQ